MDQELIDRIKSEYPAYAFLLDHGEVGPLLLQVARGDISPETFQASLMATNWWKTTSENARMWYALVNTDPATAAQRRQERLITVQQLAAQLGATLDQNQFNEIVERSLTMGMDLNSPLFRDMIGAYAVQSRAGTRVSEQSLRQLGDEYMVPLADQDYIWWAREIISGRQTEEGFKLALSDLSASRFPSLADRIRVGETPGRIFSPYRNLIAQEMDLTPDMIKLDDPKWSKVLSIADKSGVQRPMTLAETQQYVRTQDAWWKTTRGKSTSADFANDLLKTFGER